MFVVPRKYFSNPTHGFRGDSHVVTRTVFRAQAAPAPAPPPPSVGRQFSRDDPLALPPNPEAIPPSASDPAAYGAPPPPATVEEALRQRLERYRADEAKAKADGNASKAR